MKFVGKKLNLKNGLNYVFEVINKFRNFDLFYGFLIDCVCRCS